MGKKILSKSLIVILVYLLFSVVFSLLENPTIYNNTLGRISINYQHVGNVQHYAIEKAKKPFVEINEGNAYNWDAAYYLKIRDESYGGVDPHYMDRYAFYPFFPMVWNISGIRSHHIVLFNFLLFGLALIILSQLFLKDKKSHMYFFILALLLPSVIVFYLPYAESVFVLTLAIALVGLFKRSYFLYFIAMICFSMTRPAVVILIFAFIGTDIVYLFRHRNFRHFLRQSLLTIAPVIIGWITVTIMQYYYSDSWTTYFDTWDLWPKESGFLNKITDWSTEGFGMTSFSLFFLALPALIYALVWSIASLFKKRDMQVTSLFSGNETFIKEYMFNVSILFIVGVIIYFVATSGNVLNGFFRYTIAVPFFYIIFFQLPEKLKNISSRYIFGALILFFTGLVLFMLKIVYAGDIWRFEYTGLFLFVLITPFILFEKYFTAKLKMVILLIYILPAIIWHTYLFNMYLSNAWIFT